MRRRDKAIADRTGLEAILRGHSLVTLAMWSYYTVPPNMGMMPPQEGSDSTEWGYR